MPYAVNYSLKKCFQTCWHVNVNQILIGRGHLRPPRHKLWNRCIFKNPVVMWTLNNCLVKFGLMPECEAILGFVYAQGYSAATNFFLWVLKPLNIHSLGVFKEKVWQKILENWICDRSRLSTLFCSIICIVLTLFSLYQSLRNFVIKILIKR